MKICGQEMKVTLPIHGRERTFSEQELIAILEKYFSKEAPKHTSIAKNPTEGKFFRVDPMKIDRSRFEKPMSEKSWESTRKIIQEAFVEVDKHAEKYAYPFSTLIPMKSWSDYKTVPELKKYATELGGHMADWVEWALELAQRIVNGESWEVICNYADNLQFHRMIVWKNGYCRIIGGSTKLSNDSPASKVHNYNYSDVDVSSLAVPLVVLYKK